MELQYIKNDIKREKGRIVCRYNEEVRCDRLRCGKCGWNPEVARRRMEKMHTPKAVLKA
jgi:hypothetical protein